MRQTVPGFNGQPVDAQSETKWQQRVRNDENGSDRMGRRIQLDRMMGEKRLQDEVKEVWE